MKILPAIDIKDGRCVRLIKGDFNTVHKVADNALSTALEFKKKGAQYIHMVDLDGAVSGQRKNRDIIISVCKSSGLDVEVGGGIRDIGAIEDYLDNGISRVILGSSALRNPELVKYAVKNYPDNIAAGIDAKDGFVSIDGWLKTSDIHYIDFAKEMEYLGVKYIIFTDISRDGTLSGPNIMQLSSLINSVSTNIIASGGIKDVEDIRNLTKTGCYGAICGKSIYSGTLNLEDALKASGEEN